MSVIVPVLADSAALRHLIEDLRSQTHAPERIVVVSAAHDVQLAELARQHELVLIESIASRGVQLDAGACSTDSEILWFVHADARLSATACAAVVAAVEDGALGGCLRFVLQGDRGGFARVLEWLVRLRIACGGIAYGDQALFCTRTSYRAAGGFPHWPLFEEVPLVRYLRRRRGFVALDQPVFVATRRWQRDGWLRRSLHNRWLALRFALGASPEKLAAAYRSRRYTNVIETHG